MITADKIKITALIIGILAVLFWVFFTGYLFFAYRNDLTAIAEQNIQSYNLGAQAGVTQLQKNVIDEFNQKGFITLTDGQKTVYLDPVVPEEKNALPQSTQEVTQPTQ